MHFPGGKQIKIKCLVLGAADAGKTSILRRYFHKTFHSGPRVPTLGSDFYTARVANPLYFGGGDANVINEFACVDHEREEEEEGEAEEEDWWHRQHGRGHENEVWGTPSRSSSSSSPGRPSPSLHESPIPSSHVHSSHPIEQQRFVILQMWDTPGRERIAVGNPKQPWKFDASSLSDSFLGKIDAVMLVYDINSSTSFTHLLEWYADLIQTMKRISENRNRGDNIGNEKSSEYYQNLPVLVVANKLDIFHKNRDRLVLNRSRIESSVKHRDVMGLKGNFRGKNYPHEYRVISSSRSSPIIQEERPSRRNKKYPYEMSTFMSTSGGCWSTDELYLTSLLSSEDGSHPDRDIVLLWCMRNGLEHAEVSAQNGIGIEATIEKLVLLTLECKIKVSGSVKLNSPEYIQPADFQPNEELDLHKRYAPEQSQCFRLLPMLPLCKWCK